MSLLLERLWPELAGAMALGVLFAALGGPGRATASAGRPLRAGALVLLAGGWVLSWMQAVPGATGLWLDIALPLATAYGAGALAGGLLRRLVMPRPAKDDEPERAPRVPKAAPERDAPRPDAAESPTA